MNKLYKEGHYIKLFTGRGSWDSTDWKSFTEKQLKEWKVKYHELIMGKPHADIFIDDKAVNAKDWLDKELGGVKEVARDWGTEIWIVNCDEYCSKLLYLPKGAQCGEHYHKLKKETFYCLKGQVALKVKDKDMIIDSFSKPITIRPTENHSFKGITNAILLEISTHHEDSDVVFLSEGHK